MPKKKKRYRFRKHVDRRLRISLQIYLLIAVALITVACYEVGNRNISGISAASIAGVSMISGVIASRVFRISWDKDLRKVISRLDWFGGAVLVLYILFSIFREQIIKNFVSADSVTAGTITFFAGLMIGRVIGTGQKIRYVLKQQKLI